MQRGVTRRGEFRSGPFSNGPAWIGMVRRGIPCLAVASNVAPRGWHRSVTDRIGVDGQDEHRHSVIGSGEASNEAVRGVVWFARAWYVMEWMGKHRGMAGKQRSGQACCVPVWRATWSGTAQNGLAGSGWVRHSLVGQATWFGVDVTGLLRSGSVWRATRSGLVGKGRERSGAVRSGEQRVLVWLAQARQGLVLSGTVSNGVRHGAEGLGMEV